MLIFKKNNNNLLFQFKNSNIIMKVAAIEVVKVNFLDQYFDNRIFNIMCAQSNQELIRITNCFFISIPDTVGSGQHVLFGDQ